MNAAPSKPKSAPPTPRPEVRAELQSLFTRSPAFAQLPPERRQQIARDTALIADYLAAPEGIPGNQIRGGVNGPPARALEDVGTSGIKSSSEKGWEAVGEIGKNRFEGSAAMAGAKVAGVLLQQVNFVEFVGGLIRGVFQAIVDSSIKQMEEYGKLVAQVAKSLESFREDNVTPNQGRDHMVEKFPDLFELGMDDFSDNPSPRLRLHDGVDEGDALRRVNHGLQLQDGQLTSMDLTDETAETALVTAARTQLARQRQQLLASLVLMGINRIVVTDGRISAKVMYQFQAVDTMKKSRSAAAYDYRTQKGPWGQEGIATTTEESREGTGGYGQDSGDYEYSADYYSKGDYKYSQKPIVTAMSVATEASDAMLQTRAQLAGSVDVNFKSDFLPLDKVATPGMIAAIQGNSTPVDPNVVPSARNPQPTGQTGPSQPVQPQQPAQKPAGA